MSKRVITRSFKWDRATKYEDIPKWLMKLMPAGTYIDDLDHDNQFDHIRYRVQHEIDMHDEGEAQLSAHEYKKAKLFMKSTEQ